MARKSPRRTVMAETDASTVGSLEHHGDDRVKKAQAKLDRARAEACARELRDFGHRDESKVKEAHALLRRLGVSVSAVREVGSHLTRRWAFDFSMADFLDLIDGKCDADLLLESGISLLELLEAVNCVLRDAIAEYRDPDDDFSQQITVLVATEQFVLSATTQPEAKTTPETREWFAHQIIIAYINWKSAVSANEVLRASRLAARMFELRERLWWKFEHEQDAVNGKHVQARQDQGRRKRAKDAREKSARQRHVLQKAYDQLIREYPMLAGPRMCSEVARRIIALELDELEGLRRDTIERKLKPIRMLR